MLQRDVRHALAQLQGSDPELSALHEAVNADSLLRHVRATTLVEQLAPGVGTPADEVREQTIVVSHQPTLFAYTGVYVQFFLADHLVREFAERRIRARVVYLSLDADDSSDRRIRTTHIPFPFGPRGSLPLSVPISRAERGVAQLGIEAPTPAMVAGWATQVAGGFARCAGLAHAYRKQLREAADAVCARLPSIARGVDGSFAAWSAAALTGFVRPFMISPPETITMSDLVARNETVLASLLQAWPLIRDAVAAGVTELSAAGVANVSPGLRADEPAWLLCSCCQRRTSLAADSALQALDGRPLECRWCKAVVSPARILPKVVLEDLLCQAILKPSVVLTYAGSAEHVAVAEWTTPAALRYSSRLFSWHPRHLLGSAIEAATIELADDERHHDAARAAARRIVNGRDSLLHGMSHSDPGRIVQAWRSHFSRERFDEPMSLSEVAAPLLRLAACTS